MVSRLATGIAQAVVNASYIMLEYDGFEINKEYKGNEANFATEYDVRVQEDLYKRLHKILPEAEFYGEEDKNSTFTDRGYLFIIDPIDGTINFSKGIHDCCVSVGLLLGGDPIIGVVYNPYSKELFIGEKGCGAYLNGRPIHVSDEPLNKGIFMWGAAPYDTELWKPSFEKAWKMYQNSMNFRCMNSAALALCYVACGRAEMYFEMKASPWDYAAGYVIVTEAAGKVTNCNLERMQFEVPQSIVAYGTGVTEDLLKELK